MEDRILRQVLGAFAGALAGQHAAKSTTGSKIGGAFAGGVGGLFTADLVNALRDLAANSSADKGKPAGPPTEAESNPLEMFQALLIGNCMGKAWPLAVFEVILGEGAIESLLREQLRKNNLTDTDGKKLVQAHWAQIHEAHRRMAKEFLKEYRDGFSSFGLPIELSEDDIDRYISVFGGGMARSLGK
jgi:hypothetical protein